MNKLNVYGQQQVPCMYQQIQISRSFSYMLSPHVKVATVIRKSFLFVIFEDTQIIFIVSKMYNLLKFLKEDRYFQFDIHLTFKYPFFYLLQSQGF